MRVALSEGQLGPFCPSGSFFCLRRKLHLGYAVSLCIHISVTGDHFGYNLMTYKGLFKK